MRRTIVNLLATILASAAGSGAVFAQVVADSACPKHAVDIAAFATCDGDRVARTDSAPSGGRSDAAAGVSEEPGKQAPPVAGGPVRPDSERAKRSARPVPVTGLVPKSK